MLFIVPDPSHLRSARTQFPLSIGTSAYFSVMPGKRKADTMESRPDLTTQLVQDRELEASSIHQAHTPRQNLSPSHSRADVPFSSIEPSSDSSPLSSPTERHADRCRPISQDILNVNFPRDEDGFIAKVPYPGPGRDISPYAFHLRSGYSPVPYNSKDYGPRAASTPSVEASEPGQAFEGFQRPSGGGLDSGEEAADENSENGWPGEDISDEGENVHRSYHESKDELPEAPTALFPNSSKVAWDLANAGPSRMLGRPPPHSSAPTSERESASWSPKTLEDDDPSEVSPRQNANTQQSTGLRGGLLNKKDMAIIDPHSDIVRAPRKPLQSVVEFQTAA